MEWSHDFGDKNGADHRGKANLDRTGLKVADVVQRHMQIVHCGNNQPDLLHRRCSGIGQPDIFARTVKQDDTKLVLQALNHLAEGGLGQVKLLRRLGDVVQIGHFQHVFQVPHIQK